MRSTCIAIRGLIGASTIHRETVVYATFPDSAEVYLRSEATTRCMNIWIKHQMKCFVSAIRSWWQLMSGWICKSSSSKLTIYIQQHSRKALSYVRVTGTCSMISEWTIWHANGTCTRKLTESLKALRQWVCLKKYAQYTVDLSQCKDL